jgi:hypothetical protein
VWRLRDERNRANGGRRMIDLIVELWDDITDGFESLQIQTQILTLPLLISMCLFLSMASFFLLLISGLAFLVRVTNDLFTKKKDKRQ